MTGNKFYAETSSGDTIFRTERKVGEVRIPNYVYDIWMPIIGAVGMGVYGTYCRLERGDKVKGLNQNKIAKLCRIGTRKLAGINDMLVECGFIRIKKPKKAERLMHYTTEITTLDPPHKVSKGIKDKYAPESGYEVLSPWLQVETPALSNGNADVSKQQCEALSDDNANVVSLGIAPLIHPTLSAPGEERVAVEDNSGNRWSTSKEELYSDKTQPDWQEEYEYVDYDDDGFPGKAKPPIVRLLKELGRNIQSEGQIQRLTSGVPRHNPQHPSPNHLLQADPYFDAYVRDKVAWANGAVDGKKKPNGSLVSAICNYGEERFGWFVFREKMVAEEGERVTTVSKPVPMDSIQREANRPSEPGEREELQAIVAELAGRVPPKGGRR